MKKTIHYQLVAALVIFIISCNNEGTEKQKNFSHFPQKKELKEKKIKMDNFPLKLYQIEKLDTLLIAFDYYNKDKRLYIFNINNFNLIKSFGKAGKGPKELTSPKFFDLDKKNKIIWVGDKGKLKIFGYSIQKIINSDHNEPSFEIKLNKNISHFTRLRHFKDSLFFLAEGTPELLKIINSRGKIIDSIGNLPEKRKDNEPKFGFYMLWRRNIRVTNNKDILVSFMNYDKIMKIDSTGQTKFIVSGPDQITQKRKFKNQHWRHSAKAPRGYGSCYQVKKRIYCLYSGESFFTKEKYNYRQQFYKKIHVFDENGNPIIRYNLSNEIRDFVIDNKNQRIIGININSPEPFIVFPLPKIK